MGILNILIKNRVDIKTLAQKKIFYIKIKMKGK